METGWDWNPRKGYILSAVEASLKRLKTDYIDLYQLHGGTLAKGLLAGKLAKPYLGHPENEVKSASDAT